MTEATLDSSGFSKLITPDSIISLYPRKDGEAAARLGNVVDEFHDEHGLAHPRAAEGADFAAFQERADEVDYFDARFQHFRAGGLLVQRRSAAVNAFHAGAGERAAFVHGFTSTLKML